MVHKLKIRKCLECKKEFLGKKSYCPAHQKEKNSLYRKNNKEKVAFGKKRYYDDHKNGSISKYIEGHKEETAIYQKEYKEKHKDRIEENKKEYSRNHKEERAEYDKKYREENKDHIAEIKKEYAEENKEEIKRYHKKYEKERKKKDPVFKLRKYISRSIWGMLKSNESSKDGRSIVEYLTYSFEELISHIESLFESWMTWENQGMYKPSDWDDDDSSTWKWQLDHIIPHSTFEYKDMGCQEFKNCWALSNLRPLSAKQNQMDGATKIRHKKNK